MELQIIVDEKKAKQFLAFLKELNFVVVNTMPKSKKKSTTKPPSEKQPTDPDFPYFGSCPDWNLSAEDLRYGGMEKRLKGWLS
jgi:hypothetical protein